MLSKDGSVLLLLSLLVSSPSSGVTGSPVLSALASSGATSSALRSSYSSIPSTCCTKNARPFALRPVAGTTTDCRRVPRHILDTLCALPPSNRDRPLSSSTSDYSEYEQDLDLGDDDDDDEGGVRPSPPVAPKPVAKTRQSKHALDFQKAIHDKWAQEESTTSAFSTGDEADAEEEVAAISTSPEDDVSPGQSAQDVDDANLWREYLEAMTEESLEKPETSKPPTKKPLPTPPKIYPMPHITHAVSGIMLSYNNMLSYLNQTGDLGSEYRLSAIFDKEQPIAISSLGTSYTWENVPFDKSMKLMDKLLFKQHKDGKDFTPATVEKMVKIEMDNMFGSLMNKPFETEAEIHGLETLTVPLLQMNVPLKELRLHQSMICFTRIIQSYIKQMDTILPNSRFGMFKFRKSPKDFARAFVKDVQGKMDMLEAKFPFLKEAGSPDPSNHPFFHSPSLMHSCMILEQSVHEISSVVSLFSRVKATPVDRRGKLVQLMSILSNVDLKKPLSEIAREFNKSPAEILEGVELGKPQSETSPVMNLPDTISRKDAKDYLAATFLETLIGATLPIAALVQGDVAQDSLVFLATFVSYTFLSLVKDGMMESIQRAVDRINPKGSHKE